MAEPRHRRATIIALGLATLVLVVLLGGLNAFKLKFLVPRSLAQIQIFTALSVVVFLLFVVLLVLLLRNILKNLAEQRSRVLGSRLRSRMMIGAVLISFAPALFMVLFSYWLLNRSIDRWFTQPVSQLRESSTRIAYDLVNYGIMNARAEAESIVSSGSFARDYEAANQPALLSALRQRQITLQGGFAVVYRNDNTPLIEYAMPQGAQPVSIRTWIDEKASPSLPPSEPLTSAVLHAAESSDEPVLSIGGTDYSVADAALPNGGLLVVALPLPSGLGAAARHIQVGASRYWVLYRERHSVRNMYLLLILLLTVLVFFASSWLALYLSKQITRPVEALADAMDEIGRGRYSTRVTVSATQELGELVRSFNHMAADLEQSRARAKSAAAQLSAANTSLEARRKELETVLETIPNSVATLNADGTVLQANRAFLHLAGGQHPDPVIFGEYLPALFPAEIAAELELLERRAKRMGLAATEFELPGPSGVLNLTATIAALDLGGNRRGSILVMEDVTEFLRAQREVAWKQVAQRVAHEIKNPLTPVALSAERIRRHMDRSLPDSPNVIRRCVEVILSSVESMRVLVDQFAALAEFPAAQPRPADLNAIVEGALMLFHGRLDGIRVEQRLDRTLPPVMADTRSLQRALANLIDNAAEAMQGSLVRVLTVTTRMSENPGMAELILSDTGHGLTDDMRERLFLPYVSTKQRGTGLGMAIAARIVQQHGGTIRAESNSPAGARFIVELPLVVEALRLEMGPSAEVSETAS